MAEVKFYKSKKFWATISGCCVVIGKEYLGLPAESVILIVGLLSSFIIGQGVADSAKKLS